MNKRLTKRYPSPNIPETIQVSPQIAIQEFFENQTPIKPPKLLDINDVSPDPEGIIELAENGSWEKVAKLSRILSLKNKDSPVNFLKYKLCQLQALKKSNNKQKINAILEKIGNLDRPKYRYEYYPKTYPNKKGSMVPFSLRVFSSENYHSIGKTQETISQLYLLHSKCVREIELCRTFIKNFSKKNKKEEEQEEEEEDHENENENETQKQKEKEKQTQKEKEKMGETLDIINSYEKQFSENYSPIVKSSQYHFQKKINSKTIRLIFDGYDIDIFEFETIEEAAKMEKILKIRGQWMLFSLTNYHLIEGNVELVSRHLTEIYEQFPKDPVIISMIGRVHLRIGDLVTSNKMFRKVEELTSKNSFYSKLNSAYSKIHEHEYKGAFSIFKELYEKDPNDHLIINNYSIILLYQANVEKAIQILEDFIRRNPRKNLSNVIARNLCIFYRLSFKNFQYKILVLENISKIYHPSNFDYTIFNEFLK
ncbi:trafficking protein particle complex subunit [Anaeramoeba flamelloides]|uniref:Trafficking protein particle complex subunit n=1 Tax=Anaeramoeba flamelloides TaxID=1746091 RepID=A0AAV8A6Z0_9EUKA|nr:trafficking protein particle complex subunit [Anaeramoeba flamelloides]